MITKTTIKQRRPKRLARIRALLKGSEERPRLAIFRSHSSLYGHLIDDGKGITLGMVKKIGTNKTVGIELGMAIAKICKEKGIKTLIFDRGGNKYHGVIKEIADAVRKEGVTI
jgi:large subunit ribosomal protein L18